MIAKKVLVVQLVYLFVIFGFDSLNQPKENMVSGPADMVISPEDNLLYIAEHDGKRIDVIDLPNKNIIKSLQLSDHPNDLHITGDKKLLLVTQGIENGKLLVIDRKKLKLLKEFDLGHSPAAISESDNHIIVCNRFTGDITFLSKNKFQTESTIKTGREPIAMEVIPEKDQLYVVHHLPDMSSTGDTVAAKVTVIDIKDQKVAKSFLLPNGSSGIKDIDGSPDGKHLFVTHIIARFNLPTTQLERGWMNTNALSIIDVEKDELWKTILLDDVDHGAANPWAITCSENRQYIYITHAGTHEISIINWEEIKKELESSGQNIDGYAPAENLGFIYPYRKRVPISGNGPRSIVINDDQLITANYFSDNLSFVNLDNFEEEVVQLGKPVLSRERKGEMYFNDATLCFQNWQSCSSCHPDARVDGLNWDLLNDGIGNPKNVKSMLLSHKTPPVMSLGVRSHAKVAVRAGFKYIQFTEVPEEYAASVDAYLESLKPVISPFKSPHTKGKILFETLECVSCHPAPFYSNLKSYALGEDKSQRWDTPSLVELWRTGPYWHDGRYPTLKELFINEQHGLHNPLSEDDLKALEDYLLTL